MTWVYLGIAVIFEICFALSTHAAKGFTRLWPSVLAIFGAAGGVYALSLALLDLDVSVGYTIWTGVGGVGTVIMGAILFKEKITLTRLLSFAAIISGVIILRLTSI
ncbi:DMT family transporter [Streptomyces griseoruber]|uniref:Molecular chaperone n=1 Tax=Streptomyces griseoruber TaxID=1943 RepID=A0A117RCX4_9ACTN|nr:SMR family transporter [Streptomyces griseoruber]KUN83771.1 molecular chaperone [Streptomyces griseoruber]